jgi:hypothetical protein
VDIEGDARPKPRFDTRVKMLWDDQFFYVGAELREPHVWATLTEHDSVIFRDPDFEVFIDPNGDSSNTTSSRSTHAARTGICSCPGRTRTAEGRQQLGDSWTEVAVSVDGTINDGRDVDRGWTVELAFPWSVLGEFAHKPAPPRNGDEWRVNFSRVEWPIDITGRDYRKPAGAKEDNWVWSPQGVVNMHVPEMWGTCASCRRNPCDSYGMRKLVISVGVALCISAATVSVRTLVTPNLVWTGRRSAVSAAPAWQKDSRPPPPGTSPPKKNIVWSVPVAGLGHSSPVIWGNRLCITTRSAARRTRASRPASTATSSR